MTRTDYPRLAEAVYRQVLPNGLTVAVVPRPGFRRKLAYFVTDWGSVHTAFTLDGRAHTVPAGVAHYLEHKLFDMPGGDVSADFAALGGNPNAFTSYDMTAYYFSCTDNFSENLRLLLEFVSTPYFTDGSVAKEQGIIGQEIDMTADSPDSRIFEDLMQAMYGLHPIRVPILGTRESIGAITPQVLELCHRAYYAPSGMILCVVGDVDPQAVADLARQVLGDEPRPAALRQPMPAESMTCPQSYTHRAMEVAMPMFQLGFKCEPIGTGEAAVRAEFIGDLAAEALFGESSPLYLRLYEQGLIDGSFGGGFETVEGMAMLTVAGDSDDPEAVRDAILAQARVLADSPPSEADFLRMKRSALGRRIRDLDSFDSVAFRVCAYHFSGFDYMDFPRVCQAVQVQDICDFVRRAVTPQRCCLSVITPLEQEV